MMDRCGNFNFMQLNATICNRVGTILQLMQLYATYETICNYIATILQQFHMQVYANMQLYATMQHAT
jgi:hypothetical protein